METVPAANTMKTKTPSNDRRTIFLILNFGFKIVVEQSYSLIPNCVA